MLAGAYPSDEFAELKPRITWDRVDRRRRRPARRARRRDHERRDDPGPRAVRRVHGRRGRDARPAGRRARRGDGLREPGRRGHHARREPLADRGDRPRPGDRVARPGRARASCRSGTATRSAGRSSSAGRSGRSSGEVEDDLNRGARGRKAATDRLRADHDLDELAAENLVAYLEDEREVVGALPTDRRIVVERFRDELGDWRLVLLTPFGGRVHAPWSLALESRIGERLGAEVQTIWSDDGIAIRLPDSEVALDGRRPAAVPGPRGGRGPRRLAGVVVGAVRVALPRERDTGTAPAAPPARDADAALAAAPAGRRSAGGRLALRHPSRSSSRRIARSSRTCSTCPRCATCSAASPRGRSRSTASRPPGRRRSRARCCSTTSPPTCTTATRRWPSGEPAR